MFYLGHVKNDYIKFNKIYNNGFSLNLYTFKKQLLNRENPYSTPTFFISIFLDFFARQKH